MGQTDKAETLFKPDAKVIKSHLETLFGYVPKDHSDGLIEISYLYGSEFFPVKDIDAAAAKAVEWNEAGRNVYTTAAVLSPLTIKNIEARRKKDGETGQEKKSYRALASDFYYSNWVWADLDNLPTDREGRITENFKTLYKDAPPDYYVVTSRARDSMSSHLWFCLETPAFDAKDLEEVNKGIAAKLGGDKTHNCTRLMKLAGSVAWPMKAGRVTQMVTCANTGHFPPYSMAALKSAYPPPVTEREKTTQYNFNDNHTSNQRQRSPFDTRQDWTMDDVMDMLGHIPPDNDYFDWISVGMALHDYGAPFEAWDGFSARGTKYHGTEALRRKWNSFRSGGGTTIGTLYYHAHRGGYRASRAEYQRREQATGKEQNQRDSEEFDPETGEVGGDEKPKTNPITATSAYDMDLDNIPQREFLYHNLVARKFVSMLVAPPGVGKSMATIHIALSAATGKPWGEWGSLHGKPLTVWIYNNEEGSDELRRRIKGVMLHQKITKENFKGRLFIDSGEKRAITIARNEDGEVTATPDYDALIEEIHSRKIDLLIIDPFAETHAVNENSNDEIKRVTALYRDICFQTNCAVLLVHHARKGMENSNENAGNAEMARGGGAQIGVVRRAFTMSHMSTQEAARFNVPEEKRRWFVRMDDAKSNISAPATATDWFKLVSQDIGNGSAFVPEGDQIGVLEHINIKEVAAEFADNMKEERLILFSKIARIMIDANLDSISITPLSKLVIEAGYCTFKDRKLREFIAQSVEDYGQIQPVTCEGFKCIMVLDRGKTRRDGNKIILQKHQISGDF